MAGSESPSNPAPGARRGGEGEDVLDRFPLRILVGPTAAGKTALALELCRRTGAEVVSLDSMLVYRGLDVGTAKPTQRERAEVRHHMIDVVGPDERYDVQRYLAGLREALLDLEARGVPALLVGGTGFYLAAVLRGIFEGPPSDPAVREELERRARESGAPAMHAELARVDPASAARLHPSDVRRVVRALEVHAQTGRALSDWQTQWGERPSARERRARVVGLDVPAAELDRRIRARIDGMLAGGFLAEAVAIRRDPGFGPSAIQAVGYREMLAVADGELEESEAAARIALATRKFARRQRTWFRKFAIDWSPANVEEALFG